MLYQQYCLDRTVTMPSRGQRVSASGRATAGRVFREGGRGNCVCIVVHPIVRLKTKGLPLRAATCRSLQTSVGELTQMGIKNAEKLAAGSTRNEVRGILGGCDGPHERLRCVPPASNSPFPANFHASFYLKRFSFAAPWCRLHSWRLWWSPRLFSPSWLPPSSRE